MGWTSMTRPRGMTDVEFYTRELGLDRDGYEVVAHNSEGSGFSRTFYAAVRHPDGRVFAAVVISEQHGREFAWKSMDETVGPNAIGASRNVLEALTDTDYEYAKEWRNKAWADLEQREHIASITKGMKPGAWLRFTHPIKMSDGQSYQFGRFIERNRVQVAHEASIAHLIATGDDGGPVPRWGSNLGNGWKRRIAAVAASPAELRDHVDPDLLAQYEPRPAATSPRLTSGGGQGRVGRGVPAGGQFTGVDRPESDIEL